MDEKLLDYLDDFRDQLTGIQSAVEDVRSEVSNVHLNMENNSEVVDLLAAILNELIKLNENK